jgi:hypothetical protein
LPLCPPGSRSSLSVFQSISLSAKKSGLLF